MKVQMSSLVTELQRASQSASEPPAPRSATSSMEMASSAAPSIRITCLSFGHRSLTWRTFSSWSASSAITATASEFSSTYWHSSGELVW